MVYIKKMVMKGFKSFIRQTELPFNEGINVILGPNGSGKSNVSDGLCFVLGRLSIKSMRASKASNLIFLGTKGLPPAKEAWVEVVFDNSDNIFAIDNKEISIKRIVRRNGQSIYKIQGETKTRQEVLTLLAQGGIDPNGFNIILQGEIQNFVRMHTEERRKVIEEVSGISVYELRKEKSLKELSRTEEKLKEVLSILKERTAYLNNLERERQQALKYKELEKNIQRYKASIIYSDLKSKEKEIKKVISEIEEKNKEATRIKKIIFNLESGIDGLNAKIESINSTIQKSTGLEQEKLNQEISNIRADLAGMNVKSENYEKRLYDLEREKESSQELIRNLNISIKELQKETPTISNKNKEIEEKKKTLEELEKKVKKFYTTKSELKSIRERIQDKNTLLYNYKNESEFLLKQIDSIAMELFDRKTTQEKVDNLKSILQEKKDFFAGLSSKEKEMEKVSYANETEIDRQNKLIEQVASLDICPLCKNKITKEHIHSIKAESLPKIEKLKKEMNSSDKELTEIYNKKDILEKDMEEVSNEIEKRKSDLLKLQSIEEKKNQIKNLNDKIEESKKELDSLKRNRESLEKNFDLDERIEQKYETLRIELQEVSLMNEENLSSEISFKQRELERCKISLNQSAREYEDIKSELKTVKEKIENKEKLLSKKRKQEEELDKEFKELITERDSYGSKIRESEIEIANRRNNLYLIESQMNEKRIEKARLDAELENLEIDMLSFNEVDIIKINRNDLVIKLSKAQELIMRIGNVNLRSLEVYDSIKSEYEAIKEKTEIISREKESILKIIHEIDIKKKKTFLNTLRDLNEIFSKNFSQLSDKGEVWLELENKKNPFEGGVNIIVKTGHGKYFDVTSLSGGEQTLVALALIFGIQELRPYCFYILDEIDAALDKRNSSRLAGLLKKYMKRGQYIVISHNDEIISEATTLYGVSMHDGVSKIITLRL